MTKSVKILVLRNEIESILLSDILTERGIPHLIRSYHDSAYNGLWQAQAGWGHVEAPENFREEIFTIYSELQNSQQAE